MSYDNADRLTGVSWVKGGSTTLESVSYTLDAAGNRTQRVDGLGTHTYTYDANGNRLTKGGLPYTYDNADQMLTAQFAASTTAAGTDNFESNSLTGGVGWAGPWTTSGDATVTSSGFPRGSYHMRHTTTGTSTRTVDLTGYASPHLQFWAKASSFEATDQAKVRISTDGGVIWTVVKTWVDGQDNGIYTFNDIDLTPYSTGGQMQIQFKAEMGDASDFLYIDDIVVGQVTPAGSATYGYDANGNQTARNADAFTYDHENRMTSSIVSAVTTNYAYNGDGLRVSKATGGITTSYVWDIAAGLPVIIQEQTGANVTTYVYGRGLICTTLNSGAQLYRLTDGLGSTINLADSTGNVVMTYGYGVFGDLRFKYGSSPADRLFTGEQRDAETGLDYLRARYYDPAIGRFLGGDPLGGGYAYAGNNPVNRSDPTGLYEICGDNPDWGYICFDSVDVGLPANPPDACSVATNMCVWYDTGFIAACNCQADGGNQTADQVANAVATAVAVCTGTCGGGSGGGGGGGCGPFAFVCDVAEDVSDAVVGAAGAVVHQAPFVVAGAGIFVGGYLTMIGGIAVLVVAVPAETAICVAGGLLACLGLPFTATFGAGLIAVGGGLMVCGVEVAVQGGFLCVDHSDP